MPAALIVDDDERNRKLARDVLEAAGFETLEAPDGAKAIALARGLVPDVILLDLRLPDMGGVEAAAARASVSAVSRIPIVAMSASSLAGREDWLGVGRVRGSDRQADPRGHVPRAGASLPQGGRVTIPRHPASTPFVGGGWHGTPACEVPRSSWPLDGSTPRCDDRDTTARLRLSGRGLTCGGS